MEKVHDYTIGHSYINIPTICDFCKSKFDAVYMNVPGIEEYLKNYYCDGHVSIRKRYNNASLRIDKNICPECTEKLLELLDKHFPRLNLEDEL